METVEDVICAIYAYSTVSDHPVVE